MSNPRQPNDQKEVLAKLIEQTNKLKKLASGPQENMQQQLALQAQKYRVLARENLAQGNREGAKANLVRAKFYEAKLIKKELFQVRVQKQITQSETVIVKAVKNPNAVAAEALQAKLNELMKPAQKAASKPLPEVPKAAVSRPLPAVPKAAVSRPLPAVPKAAVSRPLPEVPKAAVSRPLPEVPKAAKSFAKNPVLKGMQKAYQGIKHNADAAQVARDAKNINKLAARLAEPIRKVERLETNVNGIEKRAQRKIAKAFKGFEGAKFEQNQGKFMDQLARGTVSNSKDVAAEDKMLNDMMAEIKRGPRPGRGS